MPNVNLPATLAHPFWPVKSNETSSIDGSPNSMRHHKVSLSRKGKMMVSYSRYRSEGYDVSPAYHVLTKGMLNKYFDKIVHCLRDVVGLPTCECEAALRLLRIGAYYGNVYPKASQVCSEPGCSKATFWRTVMHLKNLGLIRTIPRFRFDPHAKISSLYRLEKLVLLIAKYLAEHIAHVWEVWLKPYLRLPWPELWEAFGAGDDILYYTCPVPPFP